MDEQLNKQGASSVTRERVIIAVDCLIEYENGAGREAAIKSAIGHFNGGGCRGVSGRTGIYFIDVIDAKEASV